MKSSANAVIRNRIEIKWRYFLYITVIMLLPIAFGSAGSVLAFAVLIGAMIFRGPIAVIEGITIATLIRFTNPELAEAVLVHAIGSQFVHLVGMSVALSSRPEAFLRRKSACWWVVFLVCCGIISIFVSSYPDVSLMKIVTFCIGLVATMQAACRCDYRQIEVFIFNVMVVLVVLSLPLLAVPSIGKLRNGLGFQGITSHPQAAGTIMSLMLSWLLGVYLYARDRFSSLVVPVLLMAGAFGFLFLSAARTGMFALILTVISTVLVVSFCKRFDAKRKWHAVWLACAGVALIGVIVVANFSEARNFVVKQRVEGEVREASIDNIAGTRLGAIDRAMDSLEKSPLFGIGYGMPSSGNRLEVVYLPGTSIPISAPIEKGVLLIGILEEVGVVGLVLFCIMFYQLFRERMMVNPVYCCTLFPIIFINMGEANLLSSNGLGPLSLVFMYLQPSKSPMGKLP
jgi:hypothetical protein